MLLIFCVLISTLTSLCYCCGASTHLEITKRAVYFFQAFNSKDKNDYRWIQEHQEFLHAGTPYPDSGYLCKHAYGEISHWPPFVNAFLSYIKANFKPEDLEYRQLVSFVFGVHSHVESDIIWHWGPESDYAQQQGYLHSMSHISSDCGDVWENCHGLGDTGADLYLSYKQHESIYQETWMVPTFHLEKIYKLINLDVPSSLLGDCMLAMYAVAKVDSALGGLALSLFNDRSPFLTEELDQFYAGGLDDMAASVMWKWNALIKVLEDSKLTSSNTNTTSSGYSKTNLKYQPKKYKSEIAERINLLNVEEKEKLYNVLGIKISKENLGSHRLSVNKSLRDLKNSNAYEILKILFKDVVNLPDDKSKTIEEIKQTLGEQQTKNTQKTLSIGAEFKNRHSFSYFGQSIATGDFKGNGQQEMFIGAPGWSDLGRPLVGAVFHFNSTDYNSNINLLSDDVYLKGDSIYSKFGTSMIALDINHDGIDDLIISAPAFGEARNTPIEDYYVKDYNGEVLVYFGIKDIGIVTNAEPNVRIRTKSTDQFYNFGFTLKGGDCNNDGFQDLLIGSPFAVNEKLGKGGMAGKASVLYMLNDFLNTTQNIVYIEDIQNASFIAEASYQWFGYDLACYNNTLLVGAPGSRIEKKIQGNGAIYGFDLKSNAQLFKLLHPQDRTKFGQSLSINAATGHVAIGAPSLKTDNMYAHSGGVYVYHINDLINQTTKYQAFIRADFYYYRFGMQLLWINNDLVVSSPSFGQMSLVTEGAGSIYYYKDMVTKTGDFNYLNDAYKYLTYNLESSRFGTSLHNVKNNGKVSKLVIGAPYANYFSESLSGLISIINIEEFDTKLKFLQDK